MSEIRQISFMGMLQRIREEDRTARWYEAVSSLSVSERACCALICLQLDEARARPFQISRAEIPQEWAGR